MEHRPQTMLLCRDCEYFFDVRDKRAFVPGEDRDDLDPSCPACTLIRNMDEGWAITNDCNGLFECNIGGGSRIEMRKKLLEYPPAAECRVVPIRVYTEADDEIDMREWVQDQEEKQSFGPSRPALRLVETKP